ncbi:hypothetical protein Tco_1317748 [Tanacetum coccineum]
MVALLALLAQVFGSEPAGARNYWFQLHEYQNLHRQSSTICIVKNPVFHHDQAYEIRHHFNTRMRMRRNLIQVLKIHKNPMTMSALIILTKWAFDGPRLRISGKSHIGMLVKYYCMVSSMISSAGSKSLPAAGVLVSAGSSIFNGFGWFGLWFLLSVIFPAANDCFLQLSSVLAHAGFSAGCTMDYPAGKLLILPKILCSCCLHGGLLLAASLCCHCMGRIDSLETELGTSKKIMGGAILTLVSRVKKLERTVKHLRTAGWWVTLLATEDVPRTEFYTQAFAQFHAPRSTDVLPHADISESAGPSVGTNKGKAPMPDLEIPAEFLQGCNNRPGNASKEEQHNMYSTSLPTDLDDFMSQVGTNPALARELLGADVNEDNFIERMTAIKERKKRALADLRYRALQGKPLKQSEVTKMMRNLVKNQLCGSNKVQSTMKAVTAMSKQQLTAEYEIICRRLEKDRLLSAQYNLFRPKPAISEPPSKKTKRFGTYFFSQALCNPLLSHNLR